MAKFPITTARQELGFTPASSVRANIDTRTGEGAVGAAIGQAGLAVAGELQKKSARRLAIENKNRMNLDALSAKQADGIRKRIRSRIELMKTDTPPKEWEEETRKIVTEENNDILELDFSPEALTKQQIIGNSELDVLPRNSFADASRIISKATILSEEERLTDDYRLGRKDIVQRNIDFIESMRNNGVSAIETKLKMKAAKEAGEKLRKQDILKDWRDRIAEDPVVIAKVLNDELVLRKEGKGVILEDELTSADIQSLLNTATNRQTQLLADTQAILNAKNTALETQLHNDILAGTGSITDIANSDLPAANKRRLELDLSAIAERDIARSWAIQNTDVATEGIRVVLGSIEAGTTDINESRHALSVLAEQKTSDGRSIITKKTFDKTLEQINKGGRDAVDIFTGEQTAQVTNVLTFRLTDRQARLRIRAEARTLTSQEKRQFSTVGFLLQVAKHQLNLYEESLAQRLRTLGIEDTSGKEAKVEAVKAWELIKRKKLETRINDFLLFSGQQLVKPFGFPIETWETSDARSKAAIVNGVSKGMDNKQIMEWLIK